MTTTTPERMHPAGLGGNVAHRTRLGVGLALGAIVLSACSSGGAGDASGQQSGAGGRTARVYVITPQTGADAAMGLGVRNSVQLALRQAAERNELSGWNLEVVSLDDKSDKVAAKAAAQKAAADEQTIAVIGSIYSGLTKAAQDPLSQAGILHVSPSATNPTLTKGDAFATAAKRTHTNFFRVIAPDDSHGPALAQYARAKGVARVVVVHDGDSYGQGLAEAFAGGFAKAGGQVLATEKIDPAAPARYPDLVKKIVALKPQAVMFGGTDSNGGPLSGQLKEAGLNVPVIGGDALATDMYVPRSGPVSAGDVSTAAGAPVSSVENGKRFLSDYGSADFPESATSYGPLAYDATNALVAALKSAGAASSAKEVRAGLIDAFARVSFDGTSGKVAFDRYGDITPRVVTVNVLDGGRWKPAQTYTF